MTHIRRFNESLMRSSTLRQLKRIQGEIDRQGGDAETKRSKKEDKFPNAYWIHNPITADNSGKRKISTYEDKAEGRSVDKALESNHIKRFDELNEGNNDKEIEKAKTRIQEINKKNETSEEYSLGDVLLLNKFEKILKDNGYSKKEIEAISPSYYKK